MKEQRNKKSSVFFQGAGGGGSRHCRTQSASFSNYLFQGCASLTLSPRPEPPTTPSAGGVVWMGAAQCGRASPLRSEGGAWCGLPQPCQELPTMLPTGVPWPRQPWLSIPSHPSQHRQPLGRAEARREERKGTESRGGRGGVVKEANKKNKTTERLLHSPRLNYKPVY